MTPRPRYEVVIIGGGLAGLCQALHLKARLPDLAILIAERSAHPAPAAAHKVGESSVEIASHYLLNTLGVGDLLRGELKKFGLRFFMGGSDNTAIETRLECGPSHYLYVPSFQIDRGQFENALAARARAQGIDFIDGIRVRGVELGGSGEDHRATLIGSAGRRHEVGARWIIDASGRASLLKKKLGLERDNRHRVNAAWFRVDAAIDLDTWSADAEWGRRVDAPRRLSTNHLMGAGYWVWLIPLAEGRTSVGIVADAHLHPFSALSNFDKALAWLERFEPQCARVVRAHLDRRMDFRALRDYSHDVTKMFSADRWALCGDAGVFVDPLYSPGSDFIAMANVFNSDLVVRERRGEPIHDLAVLYDQIYRSLARTFLVTYHRQYPLMGNPRIMTLKVIWDFLMYWGGVALIFCRGKVLDTGFLERIRPQLGGFASANVRMQAFFREWDAAAAEESDPPPGFVDYAEIPFLAECNRELLATGDDENLVALLDRNLERAGELQLEIQNAASRANPKLTRPARDAHTAHLDAVFERLYPHSP